VIGTANRTVTDGGDDRSRPATFLSVWVGQMISLFGSGLTKFALGLWVMEETGSVTQFALVYLVASLPSIVLAPLVGRWVDRTDRRRMMLLADTGAAIGTGIALALLLAGQLEVWHVYGLTLWGSVASAFQSPAYAAAVPQLVSKRQLGRAAGLVQLAPAGARIAAPLVAGLLLAVAGLGSVLVIDLATFLIAAIILSALRFPPVVATATEPEGRGGLGGAWSYLAGRPGLQALILFTALTNLALGAMQVLFVPMVTALAGPQALGLLISAGGAGMLAGSLLLSAWGGPKRRVDGILLFTALLGVSALAASLRPELGLIGVGVTLFFVNVPLVNGLHRALLQSMVPGALQGRVFALRSMIGTSALMTAYLAAGPLAEFVFEPALAFGGPLATSVGALLGSGPGRGIAFMYVLLGVLLIAVTAVAAFKPSLRHLESNGQRA
jgi:MFS family permease